MADYVIRATGYGGYVRAFAATTRDLVNTLQKRHHMWPIASAAVGRTVTIGAMMGMMLKTDKHQLTIRIDGDGPLGQIVATANRRGDVRGYVTNPHVQLARNSAGKLNVGGGVGEGTLTVIQDVGLKEPYRGSVRLVSGELSEDFAYYFSVSEQTPSAVAAGVLVEPDNSVSHAGGFIVQMLPNATEEVITEIETAIQQLSSVTDLLRRGATPETLLDDILRNDLVIHEKQPIHFRCQCSYKRVTAMLKALGAEEIQSIIETQGQADVTCHFCNETYTVSKEALKQLFE